MLLNEAMDSRSGRPSQQSYKIAAGALLAALCWLLLLGAGFLPTGRLFVLMIASFVISIAIRETGAGGAVLVYLLASILALITPGLVTAAQFALFFGILPLLIKWLRNHLNPAMARLVFHLLMTGLLLGLVFFFGPGIFALQATPFSWLITALILALLLQLFLFVYLYALGQFERFYEERIAPLRRHGR